MEQFEEQQQSCMFRDVQNSNIVTKTRLRFFESPYMHPKTTSEHAELRHYER
jgi:hypothetical protein